MKTTAPLTAALCLLFLTAASAHAAKADGPKAKLFAKYDKNKDGVINGEEKDVLRKDFAAEKEGSLKKFDTNKNGKLDDDEVAAIKPPTGKKKSAKTDGEKSGKAKGGKKDKAEKIEKTDKPEKTDK